MAWKSAHAGLKRLADEYRMKSREDSRVVDTGDSLSVSKVIVYFPNPSEFAISERPKARDEFYDAAKALRIRPSFEMAMDEMPYDPEVPTPVRRLGTVESSGMAYRFLEVVCACEHFAAQEALRTWQSEVKEESKAA